VARPTQALKVLKTLAPMILLFGVAGSAQSGTLVIRGDATSTSLCQLNNNEGALLGKVLRVHARLYAWWEGSVLKDASCPAAVYALSWPSTDYLAARPKLRTFEDELTAGFTKSVMVYDLTFDAQVQVPPERKNSNAGLLKITDLISSRRVK